MQTYATLPGPLTITEPLSFTASLRTVKLLDLASNRYCSGIIREDWGFGLALELPLTSLFQTGQPVRFVIAGNQALIARHDMQSALITHARRTGRATHVELTILSEAAAA